MVMEIEVKATIQNLISIKQQLQKIGVRFNKPIQQVDHYFKFKDREWEPQGPGSPLLRVRKTGEKLELTAKKLTKRKGVWEEYETTVSNKNIFNILSAIGFVDVLVITKTRLTGNYKQYQLCLDMIKELGSYIEIETFGKDGKRIQKEIITFLESIGIQTQQIERRGYAQILFERMGIQYSGEK